MSFRYVTVYSSRGAIRLRNYASSARGDEHPERNGRPVQRYICTLPARVRLNSQLDGGDRQALEEGTAQRRHPRKHAIADDERTDLVIHGTIDLAEHLGASRATYDRLVDRLPRAQPALRQVDLLSATTEVENPVAGTALCSRSITTCSDTRAGGSDAIS